MAERNREMYLKRREFREKKQTSYEKPSYEKKTAPPARRPREQEVAPPTAVEEEKPAPKVENQSHSKYEKQVTKLIRQNLDVGELNWRLTN